MVANWLPVARGETVAALAVTRFTSFAVLEAYLIWLPAARGESSASLAVALMVIAARAATPMVARRIRVFIFLSVLGGASLRHRMVVFAIHRQLINPAKYFREINSFATT
jgi:hypothetical protein